MGEITIDTPNSRSGKNKRKKHSTRVDLTPMVDLGFLLITFFIFTTSMSDPTAMKLILPHDNRTVPPMKAAEEKTLHLIIGADRQWWTYAGTDLESISAAASLSEIRERIRQKRQEVIRRYGDATEYIVLIKPTEQASYEDVVDALDEMTVNAVTRHVLMEPSEKERDAITSE